MIDHAREDLTDRLRTLMDSERSRFDRLVPDADPTLPAELRGLG
jgi:hypothetical protein